MTIEEKREALWGYCAERVCNCCKLSKVNKNGEKETAKIGRKAN